MKLYRIIGVLGGVLLIFSACRPVPHSQDGKLKVLAVESFLADITRQVAGQHVEVDSLIPLGMDPHAFEPVPADVARISECDVLIVNGAGLEMWLENVLQSVDSDTLVIEASKGLTSRTPAAGLSDTHAEETDPHFWLNPLNVIRYVENIRDGLSSADPQGKAEYERNAQEYSTRLKELDTWIKQQVDQIPLERRLMVTNHESFGYFADQYGFKMIGAIIPGTTTGVSPTAQQMAALVDQIKNTGAPAIFIETGSNLQLAEQIAQETGVKVVTDLYTHSLTASDGPVPGYIEMMKYDTTRFVEALKP